MLVTDPKTGQDKWQSPVTKNELARAMLQAIVHKQIPFGYVLTDIWFASAQNMVFLKNQVQKDFILPLKSNRKVALTLADKQRGQWTTLAALNLETAVPQMLHADTAPGRRALSGGPSASSLHKRRW